MKVAAKLHHPQVLLHFLRNDVAEHATLFALKYSRAGAQFVEHAARHEGGCGKLRSRMLKLLPRAASVILEDADILEAPVAFKILNALRGQQQELLNLGSLAFHRCRSCLGFSTSTSCAPTGRIRS